MKKFFVTLTMALILCFMVGCQDKEALAELEAMKAQAEVEEQNRELILHLFDELDKKNYDIVNDLSSPNAKLYGAGSFEPIPMVEVAFLMPMWYEGFFDYKHSVKDVIAKGDRVVVRCHYSGTHTGEFLGISATGKTIEYGGIGIWQIKEGKIVGAWLMEDMLWLMQQLGMELRPKEAEK